MIPDPTHEAMRDLVRARTAAMETVRRARQQLREMILDCCTIDRDARGGVTDYQTTARSARYCGRDEDLPQGRCGG